RGIPFTELDGEWSHGKERALHGEDERVWVGIQSAGDGIAGMDNHRVEFSVCNLYVIQSDRATAPVDGPEPDHDFGPEVDRRWRPAELGPAPQAFVLILVGGDPGRIHLANLVLPEKTPSVAS